jgi:hypothetical protein
MEHGQNASFPPTFPPPGWVTNREAAQRLGVGLETLTCHAWKWHTMLSGTGRCVRIPTSGGRCNIYPAEAIEQIIAARDEADRQTAEAIAHVPKGFVDRDGACRFFGVPRYTWKKWVSEGKVTCGRHEDSPRGGRRVLYAVVDLERLKAGLFGEDKLYKRSDGLFHVPAGLVRREQACLMFGVSLRTWERWEREGKITCGERVAAGPKLYKLEDVRRMLMEFGRLAPPYPDPDRPGCYRVPLSGRDIHRREAIVDADALPLIQSGACTWSQTKQFAFVSFYASDGAQRVPLRRIIMGVEGREAQIGHANDDPLDCRRANLVLRTASQRCSRQRKRLSVAGKAPTSRFKGVYWETQTKKWRASIGVNGKSRRLGRFGDEMAAAVAYDEAARQWFGEHARLNFPDGVDAWVEQERARWEREEEAARQAA